MDTETKKKTKHTLRCYKYEHLTDGIKLREQMKDEPQYVMTACACTIKANLGFPQGYPNKH